jgi:hypothetical protein
MLVPPPDSSNVNGPQGPSDPSSPLSKPGRTDKPVQCVGQQALVVNSRKVSAAAMRQRTGKVRIEGNLQNFSNLASNRVNEVIAPQQQKEIEKMRAIAEAGNTASKKEVGEACAKILGSTIVAATLEPLGAKLDTLGKVVMANGHPVFLSPQAGFVVIGDVHNGKGVEENSEAQNTLGELLKPESAQSATENVPTLGSQEGRLSLLPSVERDSSSLSVEEEGLIEKTREQGKIILLPHVETTEVQKVAEEFASKELSQIQHGLVVQKEVHSYESLETFKGNSQQSFAEAPVKEQTRGTVLEDTVEDRATREVFLEKFASTQHIMATASKVEAFAAAYFMEKTLRPMGKSLGITVPVFEKRYDTSEGTFVHTEVNQIQRCRLELKRDIPEEEQSKIIEKLLQESKLWNIPSEEGQIVENLIQTKLEFLSQQEKAAGEEIGEGMSNQFLGGFGAAVAEAMKRIKNEMKAEKKDQSKAQPVADQIKNLPKRQRTLIASAKASVQGEFFIQGKSLRDLKKELMKFIETLGIEERQRFYEYLQSLITEGKVIHDLILEDYAEDVERNQEKEFEQILKDRGQAISVN